MKSTALPPQRLDLRNVQNPLQVKPMPKPTSPKPSPLEREMREAEANFNYCLEKGDIQRSLHWSYKRKHLHKLFLQSRNGQHDDSSQHPQEQHDGGRRQEDPCGRHEGSGVARLGEAHIRRSEEVRPDEDQEGSHRQQEEARARQEVSEEPQEGRLRGQEGDV
jgi:hypothetical protein